jgi:DNA-binding NtrC family response regulator
MQNPSIIIVDKDKKTKKVLQALLSKEGYKIQTACTASEALKLFKLYNHQLVIADIKLSDCSGLQILNNIKAISSSTPVLILSSHGTIEIAVKAMQQGAADFLSKPFSNESIIVSVKEHINRQGENIYKLNTNSNPSDRWRTKKLITNNAEMISLKKYAKNIAKSNASVLIQGESGTGKELLAAYIVHHSGREKQPYIAMNCAVLPDNLAESELFGHEKGAFTGAFQKRIGKFEQANHGTLLLDEISELSLKLQAKLLRVLQEKIIDRLGGKQSVQVDTRIISTCNVDLKRAVRDGSFRKDLYYRINVIPFTILPLRKRKDDIPMLCEYFISKYCYYNKKKIDGITPDALEYLNSHEWPGNVRELENVIERAVLIAEEKTIIPEYLMIEKNFSDNNKEVVYSVGTTVKDMEKKLIFRTLRHVNENRTHAAQLLGISIRTLRNKLREYQAESLKESELALR